jgi:hypothetical protein
MNTVALSRLLASQCDIDTWSDLGPKSSRKGSKIHNDHHVTTATTDLVLSSIMADHHIRWIYVDETMSVGVATSLHAILADGSLAVTMSATNYLYTTIPSGFDFSALSESFVLLLSKDDSTASGFNILPGIIPDTIERPGESPPTCNTLKQLGFPGASGGATPRFAIAPKVLLIPPGYHIPEGHPINQPLPTLSGSSVYWHPFEIWCNKGIKNLVDLSSSSPANAPGANLFKHETIDIKGGFPSVILSATFPLPTTVLPRIYPAYKVTKEVNIDNTKAGRVQWYSTLKDIPAGFGHANPTPAPTHDAADI